MLKYYNYDIVFQEIPDETTLAVNLTGCPFTCEGCHSPHLRQDIGEPLTQEALLSILSRYSGEVTCICLMGGDAHPLDVQEMAGWIRSGLKLKSGWYSGAAKLAEGVDTRRFDYIKIGPYIAAKGGLNSEKTNQRLYMVEADGSLTDITYKFARKNRPL